MEEPKKALCSFCKTSMVIVKQANGFSGFICVNPECLSNRMNKVEKKINDIEKFISREEIPLQTNLLRNENGNNQGVNIYEEIKKLSHTSPDKGKIIYVKLRNILGEETLITIIKEIAQEFSDFDRRIDIREWVILHAYAGNSLSAAKVVLREIKEKIELIEEILVIAILNWSELKEKVERKSYFSALYFHAKSLDLSESLISELRRLAGIPLPVKIDVNAKKTPLSVQRSPLSQKVVPPQYSSWIERKTPDFGWEFEFGSNWLRWIGVGAILLALFFLISWSSQFVKISRETVEIIIFMTILTSGIILHLSSLYLYSRHPNKTPYVITISRSLSFLSLGIYFLCLFALRFHPGSPLYQDEIFYLNLILVLVIIIFLTGWKIDSNLILIEGQAVCLWIVWHVSSQIVMNNTVFIGFSLNFIWISTIIIALACYFIAYLRKSLSFAITTEIFPLLLLVLTNSSSLLGDLSFLPQINYTLILLSFSCILCLFITITFHSNSESILWGTINRQHLSLSSLLPVFLGYYLLYSSLIPIYGFIILQIVFVSAFIIHSIKKSDLGVSLILLLSLQLLWLVQVTTYRLSDYYIFPGVNSLTVLILFQVIIVWIVIMFSEHDDTNRLWNYITGKHLQWLATSLIVIIGLLFQEDYIQLSIFFSLLVIFPLLGLTQQKRLLEVPDYSEYVFSLSDILTYLSMLFYVYILTNEGTNIAITLLGFIYFPVLLLLSQYRTNRIQQNNGFRKIYPLINTAYVGFIFSILLYEDVLKDAVTDLFWFTRQFQVSLYEIQSLLTLILFSWIMTMSIITIHYYRKEIRIWGVKLFLMSLFPVLFHLILADRMVSVSIAKIFLLLEYAYFIICWSLIREDTDEENDALYEKYILIPVFALIQYSGIILVLREITALNIFFGWALYLLLPLVVALLLLIYNDITEIFDTYFMISSFLVFIFLIIAVEEPSIYAQLDFWIIGVFFLINSSIFFVCRILEKDLRLTVTQVLPIIKTKIKTRRNIHAEASLRYFLLFATLGFLSNTISFFSYPEKYQLILILITLDFIIILVLIAMQNRFLTVNTLNIYCLILFIRLLVSGRSFPNQMLFLVLGIVIQISIHGILLFQAKFYENLNIIFLGKKLTLRGVKNWLEDSYQITSFLNPVLFYFFSGMLINLVINEYKISNISVFDIIVIISLMLLTYTIFLSRLNVSRYICEGGLFVNLFLAGIYSFYNTEAIYIIAALTAFHSILYGFWNNKQGWRITGLGIIGYALLYGSITFLQISDDLIKILGLGLLGIFSILIGVIYTKFAEKFQEQESHESLTH